MAHVYSRLILTVILSSTSPKLLNPGLWCTLAGLGLSRSRPTRQGCRAGRRKQRPITTCLGLGRHDDASNQLYFAGYSELLGKTSEDGSYLHIPVLDSSNIHLDASRKQYKQSHCRQSLSIVSCFSRLTPSFDIMFCQCPICKIQVC